MIVEELVTTLGLDIDSGGLDNFRSSIVGTTLKIGALVGVTFTAAAAISALLDAAAETTNAARFARSMDVGFESLQRLEFAAKQSGTSVGALRGALGGLRSAAQGAFIGENDGAAVSFARLGVEIRNVNGSLKTADQLLLDVAGAVAGAANPELARNLAEQLGLGPELILLLRLGASGINDLANEGERLGAILSDDAAKKSEAFTQAMDKLKSTLRTLLIEGGKPIVAWLTGFVEQTNNFLKSDRAKNLGAFFSSLAKDLKILAGTPIEALNLLSEFLSDATGLDLDTTKLVAFGTAIGVLGLVVAPTATILLGLLLVLNDIINLVQGKDSIIGRFGKAITEDLAPGFALMGGAVGFAPVPATAPSADEVAGGPAAARGGTVNNTVNQEVKAEINGVSDPAEVKRLFDEERTDALRAALEQLRSPMSN